MNEQALVTIELEFTMGITWPKLLFDCNVELVADNLVSEHQRLITYKCYPLNMLKFDYTNKTPNETVVDSSGSIVRDQTVSIKKLWIDNILVPQYYLTAHGNFYPRYNSSFLEYCKENNIVVNQGILHETKFWHCGIWEFSTPHSFWIDFFEYNQSLNRVESDFVGYNNITMQQQLKQLKDVLTNAV